MDRLAHKCVSLQFLLEIYEQVVQPYRPTMTVKQVVEEIIIPATKDKQCSFIDHLLPNMYLAPHAFISHAFANPFTVIVNSLLNFFKDAVYSEVYVWIDIFIINQHRPGDDLHGGETLKATIEASGSVVVCLDKNTLPLFRLWCLYEIGSAPIEKLVLLTHGFDASELGLAFEKIDATTADCWAQTDKDMIREHIRTMMIEQKVVHSGATVTTALTAFTRVLKLLLILKPMSYSVDIAALLARAEDYQNYPLNETVERACTGGRLICIAGASGEGKSTLAAALVKTISIDAYHFCKQADIRRQDRGMVIRSLSYQLAIKQKDFAQSILDMSPSQVESLTDEALAWKLLLEIPLRAAFGWRATILVDALDESGLDGRMISLLVDLDKICGEEGSMNIIVTIRPEPALIVPLRSHWKGERYKEFAPSKLRGEAQTGKDSISPLLRTLTDLIRRIHPDPNVAAPADLNAAYSLLFDVDVLNQHRAVLEVVLASYEPQSLADLKAIDMLEMVRGLPGYGDLFLERENKLHLLHRSIAEWLLGPKQGAIDAKSGHARLAEHIWHTALRPWLLPSSSSSSSKSSSPPLARNCKSGISLEPPGGSYSLKYALDHLREANRLQDIQAILFRLPWLQAMLKEKGLGALIKDMLSLHLADHPSLAASMKKLLAVLRLSSSALLGSDAWKCLPSQLLGRLRETEEEPTFQQLCQEANSFFSAGEHLKPIKLQLKAPGSLELTMVSHSGQVFAISILPDGRIVSGADDHTVRIWNIISGDCERILKGHSGSVTAVSTFHDGRIVSGSWDKTLRIWNAISGDCEKTLEGHSDMVTAISILPDGRIVSGSHDKTVRIWNASSGNCEKVLKGHSGPVTAISIRTDSRIVSGFCNQPMRIWNTTSGDCEKILKGQTSSVNAIAFLPDGRIVSGSDDHTVRIWNATSGVCKKILKGHSGPVTAISILPDGRIVSGSHDQTVRIWNATSEEGDRIPEGHSGRVAAISILPDGRIVSASEDHTVCIWNTARGDCELILKGHSGRVTAMFILPDGRLVSGSTDETARIWNTGSGDCEKILKGPSFWVVEFRSLLDGRLLSRDGHDQCLLWSTLVVEEGELRIEPISGREYDRLLEGATPSNGSSGAVLVRVAPGYSVSQNCVQSRSFGRVFVDEAVEWVVKVGDVIAVFEKASGRDHWLRQVQVSEEL